MARVSVFIVYTYISLRVSAVSVPAKRKSGDFSVLGKKGKGGARAARGGAERPGARSARGRRRKARTPPSPRFRPTRPDSPDHMPPAGTIAQTVDWLVRAHPVVFTGRAGNQPLLADPFPLFQQNVQQNAAWWAEQYGLDGGCW